MSTVKDVTEQIGVTLSIDLNTAVDTAYRQTGEDTYGTTPLTVLDLVIDRVAGMFIDKITKDDYRGIKARVDDAIKARIDSEVMALIDKEMHRSWQPVDDNGVPTAARTTLVDRVMKATQRELTAAPPADRYSNNKPTVAEEFVKATAAKVVRDELAPVLAEAKANIVAQVQASFSEVLGPGRRVRCGEGVSAEPYECDHGTCIRKATTTVTNSYGEARRGCAKHAKYMGVAA